MERIWQFLNLSFIVNCRKEFSNYTCKSFLSCWIDKKISGKSVSKPTEAISNHTNRAYNCQYRHIYPKNSSGQKFNQWNYSVILNNCRNIYHAESHTFQTSGPPLVWMLWVLQHTHTFFENVVASTHVFSEIFWKKYINFHKRIYKNYLLVR